MTAFEFGQRLAKRSSSPEAARQVIAKVVGTGPAVARHAKNDLANAATRFAFSAPALGMGAAGTAGAIHGYGDDPVQPIPSALTHAALWSVGGLTLGALASRALPKLF